LTIPSQETDTGISPPPLSKPVPGMAASDHRLQQERNNVESWTAEERPDIPGTSNDG
jgi:hypothetical protein